MFSKAIALGLAVCLPALTAGSDQAAQDEQRLGQLNLKTDGASLLAYFRGRTVRTDQEQVKSLIGQLSHRSFGVRQRAANRLRDLGARAVPQLKEATKHQELEVRRKAEEILREIVNASQPEILESAGRLLVLRNPDGAAEALLDFLPSVLEEATLHELHRCLAKLALRDGKLDPVVIKALTDESPVRRAAAAVALSQAGTKPPLDKVRPLLRDTDATVRLHAGLGLLRHGDKEAVPVLVGLFEKLSRNQLWRAEDALYQLAGEHAPNVALGDTPQEHKAFCDAWLGWWKKHGDKIDIVDGLKEKRRDWTLIVLLDENIVLELDAKDNERFRMDKLAFPLDAQTLTGDRVLLAEHGGARVTERLRDGTVLWEQKAAEPLAAQRLDNGNTFIGSKSRIVEVDREGKEVFAWAPNNGEQIMRAKKLPDNTYAVILQERQRYIRVDRQGNEVEGFSLNVNVQTFGGRIDVQPNGNVLIPQMYNDRVVEFDAKGKTVREFNVGQPIVALRLSNGNTMVTSMNENRAVELDPAGKQVWEYRAKSRVTRAYRR